MHLLHCILKAEIDASGGASIGLGGIDVDTLNLSLDITSLPGSLSALNDLNPMLDVSVDIKIDNGLLFTDCDVALDIMENPLVTGKKCSCTTCEDMTGLDLMCELEIAGVPLMFSPGWYDL